MKSTDLDGKMREAFSDSAGFLLGRSHRILKDRLEKALASFGMSLMDYACLRMISTEVANTQAVLSEICGIDQATMVGILDRLEEQRLVSRQRNPADRRAYQLRLTVKGTKVLSRAGRVAGNQQREFLSPLSPAEWELVRACLLRIIGQELESQVQSYI